MRICFYSPYMPDHFGGGEKHLLDVAVSAARFHQVYIGISENKVTSSKSLKKIQAEYKNFFNASIDTLEFVSVPLGTTSNAISKLNWTREYDAIYYVTDGSLFFSLAKNNFLHVQVPLRLNKNNFLERVKLSNWKHINTNSYFTKSVIESSWKVSVNQVLEPMVDLDEFNNHVSRKKIILNVGRFFRQLHSKRQDVLIEMFKQLLQKHPQSMKGWKLLLVGAVEDPEYVAELTEAIGNLPISLLHSVSRPELINLYQSSSIYWHATGYDVNEETHPEKVEHFGISTVEAMAAGAIPVVHFKGGQKEILGDELEQLGWLTKAECVKKTIEIIENDTQTDILRDAAKQRASEFSKFTFDRKVEKLFSV